MDCKYARVLTELARPRSTELEPGETAALESHLAVCPECGPQAQQQRLIDEHLGQAMRDVPIRENLRNRLLRRLAAQRDAWYRSWLMRVAGILLAAAAIVLLVWGAVWWRSTLRQPFDPQELAELGEGDEPNAKPEDVSRWLKEEHGIQVPAPRDVEYFYFSHCSIQNYRGKRVPRLVFVYNNGRELSQAVIYIVTDAQFHDLDEQVNQPPRGTRGYEIKVVSCPEDPHVYFVRIFTKGSEGRFFKANNGPAL
jgi:hypothetical protein